MMVGRQPELECDVSIRPRTTDKCFLKVSPVLTFSLLTKLCQSHRPYDDSLKKI